MDIKIANYTEESTGRNIGATGSGKVVIGLYGKAAPESVKRFMKSPLCPPCPPLRRFQRKLGSPTRGSEK